MAAVLGLACLLGGCGTGSGRERPPAAAPAPVVRGADTGVEVVWWVVDDREGALAGALRTHLNRPLPADPAQARVWRDNGLRIVAIPVGEVEELRSVLPVIGPVQRQWFGLLAEWAEIVKGPELGSFRQAQLDTGVLRLEPGRLRLLARCWAVPRTTGAFGAPSARLRVELMPQLAERRRRDPMPVQAGARRGDALASGLAFPRLTLALSADGGEAFLIVAASPEEDWSIPAGEARPETAEDAAGRGAVFHGPPPPDAPTVGELMLTGAALGSGAETTRVVVVVVPRVAERFELIRN